VSAVTASRHKIYSVYRRIWPPTVVIVLPCYRPIWRSVLSAYLGVRVIVRYRLIGAETEEMGLTAVFTRLYFIDIVLIIDIHLCYRISRVKSEEEDNG
jgi:hypothetical protein